MGGSMTKTLQPQELAEFKKIPQSTLLDEISIPEKPENRTPTDKNYLIVFGVVALLLMPFLIYTLAYSDFDRLSGKIDQCGNICGKKNKKYDEWSCTGKDFTDKSVLQLDRPVSTFAYKDILTVPRRCVESCSSNFQTPCIGSSSLSASRSDKDTYGEIERYLNKFAWRITLACFLSLGVALGTLYLFRWATAAMVWSLLVSVIALLLIATIAAWVKYATVEQDTKSLFLFFSIFSTIMLLIIVCVIVFLARKIKLVIALLREAMKAAFDMPQLMFVPILTFIPSAIIVGLFVTSALYIATAGSLTELTEGYLYYEPSFIFSFTSFFNLVMTVWSLQFVIGLQYMVIAGAVAKWYFAKNKNYLGSPILTSVSVTFQYHLGTLAFGSMVITLIMIIRALISSAIKNKYFKVFADFCLSSLEQFLKFLSKNAYIMTAMHGKPFYKSGKRAAQIIFQNAVNVAAINFIGDFILGLAQLAIIAVSMVLTYLIIPVDEFAAGAYAVYFIVFIISLIIASIFFAIFETVIDTIFLCFCEDTLLNDGMSRPFAMSSSLMQFMDNAKKVFGEKKK